MASYYYQTAVSVKDRTSEFHSLVDASKPGAQAQAFISPRERLLASSSSSLATSRAGTPTQPQGSGQGQGQGQGQQNGSGPTKGEFAKRAQAIGKDISDTTAKLGRLAQLAKRKTMFDDRPVEISELTYIIKHDIAAINRQLSDLQAYNKAQAAKRGGGNKGKAPQDKAEEHRGNVVTLLQTKLAGATTSFQDILEIRTQNMKASRDRTEQFAYGAQALPGENSGE